VFPPDPGPHRGVVGPDNRVVQARLRRATLASGLGSRSGSFVLSGVAAANRENPALSSFTTTGAFPATVPLAHLFSQLPLTAEFA
jgi:hypothetical protein